MGFCIRFLGSNRHVAHGEIVLADFVERFESPLGFWKTSDYEEQWRQGLSRLFQGALRSALVTVMPAPEEANFILWWVLYRDGETVVVRNHLLLMEQLGRPFELDNLYEFVPDRLESSDEEFPASEWTLGLHDLKLFAGA